MYKSLFKFLLSEHHNPLDFILINKPNFEGLDNIETTANCKPSCYLLSKCSCDLKINLSRVAFWILSIKKQNTRECLASGDVCWFAETWSTDQTMKQISLRKLREKMLVYITRWSEKQLGSCQTSVRIFRGIMGILHCYYYQCKLVNTYPKKIVTKEPAELRPLRI